MTKPQLKQSSWGLRRWLCGSAASALLVVPFAARAQEVPPPSADDSSGSTATSPTSAEANAAGPQQAPADAPRAADSTGNTGIADIVVTAQRRSEPLQRAAIAVDVVSSDALTAASVTQAAQLTNLVPALQVTNSGGSNTSFYLRGVGAFTNNSYADPAIAFNYDGVYVGRPAGTSGVFFDIDRVEVLKGPQGTLYGRNATGGAVNVLPRRPELGRYSGFANVSYGNYDALNLQGALNAPLGDRIAARVSGTIINRHGYLSDGTSDDKGYAVRGQLRYDLTDNLDARLAADFYHADGKGGGASYLARILYNPATRTYTTQTSGLGPEVGLLDPRSGVFLTQTFSNAAGRTTTPIQREPFLDNDSLGINAEINWGTDLGKLTVVPAYRRFRQRGIQDALGFLATTDELDKQVSLEARFATDASRRLSALAGVYLYKEDINSYFTIQQQVLSTFQDYKQSTASRAAFGRVTFRVAKGVRLVGGGRYTSDTKKFEGVRDALLTVCIAATRQCPGAPLLPFATSAVDVISQLGLVSISPSNSIYRRPGDPAAANTIYRRGLTPLDIQRTDKKFTYRAAAEWDVGPASLLYASYETGFRSGGFSFSSFNPTFGPEAISALTIGSKNRFFGNRLQVNLEGFYWKYRDQQVSHQGTDPSLGQSFFTENIGRSTNKGVEVEAQYRPYRNTQLSADVQYLRARYDNFIYEVPAFAAGNPTPPPIVNCSVTPPSAATVGSTFTIDCSGKQAFRSPTWTVNVGAAQTFRFDKLSLVAEGGTRYQSANNTGFEFLDVQRTPGYFTSNASLTLKDNDDRWTASVFVLNIEDNRKGTFTFVNGTVATISQVTTPPRTYGARLGFRF